MRATPLSATPSPPSSSRPAFWEIRNGSISLDEPVVMGILNVTPDSFSDGGELPTVEAAIDRAAEMVTEGAGILDVGGESTRPGAAAVDPEVELERVVPVIEGLADRFEAPISVDTRKARVAREALSAGARVVNDVSGLAFDPDLAGVVAAAGAGIVVMHMRGTPEDMRDRARYTDLLQDVTDELIVAVDRAQSRGIEPESIVLDPGIGFAKNPGQSFALLGGISRLCGLGFPVMVGPSRKSFLGELLGVSPGERAVGTAAACVIAFLEGARLFRVHDVAPAVHALRVAHAVRAGNAR